MNQSYLHDQELAISCKLAGQFIFMTTDIKSHVVLNIK